MTGQAKPKRRIRNFLLDPRFQLKYTLAVVLISGAISVGLGVKLYQSHRESSKIDSLEAELDEEFRKQLLREDRKVIVNLVVFLGGLVVVLTGLGIVATHKIAGPAYALKATLAKIADGRLPNVRNLRRGDELRDLAGQLRNMVEQLRAREESELVVLLESMERLKASGVQENLLEELQKLAERKKSRIEDT